jgi:hypothetical protein
MMTTKSTMQNNIPNLLAILITMQMRRHDTERITQ